MATKRRRIGARRLRHAADLPLGARWWLNHGTHITLAQAYAFDLGDRDAWTVSNLAFDRAVATGWTRRELRELGFGEQIDGHIAAGRCAPDRR